MPKVQVGRTLTVYAPLEVVKQRLTSFARMYEFELVDDTKHRVVFKRGTLIGNFMSFDVQKVTSSFTVDISESDGQTSATAVLIAGSFFQILSAGDRGVLERQMDIFVSTLKGS